MSREVIDDPRASLPLPPTPSSNDDNYILINESSDEEFPPPLSSDYSLPEYSDDNN
ncbi:Hypothetical protein FKW44_019749 [Caligus rogercresseyi]|uniref:Uncharacterized protein n=1 Tax=Caligus rogercresseyi TaxID=217165 RepID=A0A7T8GWA8_CALRO|nr:Hypothetical protein FKW44_019749 [Caligus rogercresseyi]